MVADIDFLYNVRIFSRLTPFFAYFGNFSLRMRSFDHITTSSLKSDIIFKILSQKTVQNCFLSERRHISTNFDNFWQKDGKEARIIRDALIFHLI